VRHLAFPILQVAINVLHSCAIVVPRICLLVFYLSLIFCLLSRSHVASCFAACPPYGSFLLYIRGF
jgi:hypothetical protein